MKVITYQSPRGGTINVTPRQEAAYRAAGTWPRDRFGEEYCSVSHGLHVGQPTFPDVGDRVSGGKGEDYDAGRVLEIIDAERVDVAWDSGVRTPAVAADLTVE